MNKKILLSEELAHSLKILQDDMKIKEMIHEKETALFKSLEEVTETDCDKLDESIQLLHLHYENKLKHSREEIQDIYTIEVDLLKAQIIEQEKLVSKLENEISNKDKEIKVLKVKEEKSLDKFKKLMNDKISLSNEIDRYRLLLEEEELRMGICSNKFTLQKVMQPPRNALNLENEGNFIQIINKTNEPWDLYGCVLETSTEVDFTFTRSLVLEPGKNIKVWSADSDVRNEPPINIVMRNKAWMISEKMTTTLKNKFNDVIAIVETNKKQKKDFE